MNIFEKAKMLKKGQEVEKMITAVLEGVFRKEEVPYLKYCTCDVLIKAQNDDSEETANAVEIGKKLLLGGYFYCKPDYFASRDISEEAWNRLKTLIFVNFKVDAEAQVQDQKTLYKEAEHLRSYFAKSIPNKGINSVRFLTLMGQKYLQ